MTPEQLAGKIERAVERRQRSLVPGLGNRLFALLGRLAPGLIERSMERAILRKL
jgi:hypothetical protein